MIRRAAPAVTEGCEDLRQIAGATHAVGDLQFDEFHLVATVRWTPHARGLPEELNESLENLARSIARHCSCSARLQPGRSASLVFEH